MNGNKEYSRKQKHLNDFTFRSRQLLSHAEALCRVQVILTLEWSI